MSFGHRFAGLGWAEADRPEREPFLQGIEVLIRVLGQNGFCSVGVIDIHLCLASVPRIIVRSGERSSKVV